MGLIKEFKEFAVRGNVMDMAIGIIIGGAFTPIVKSMVDDVIMPPIGLLTGGIDFSDKKLVLQSELREGDQVLEPLVTLNYGNFINTVITFVIVAFAVFLLVKAMNRLRRQEAPPPAKPTTKDCPQCLMAIPLAARKCGHCTSPVAA